MATLYIVNRNGLNGIVNPSDVTTYSLTSGGASAGVLPTQYDDIVIDTNTSATPFSFKLTAHVVCKSIIFNNLNSGIVTIDSNLNGAVHYMITFYGSIMIDTNYNILLKGSQTSGWIARGTGSLNIDIRCLAPSITFYNGGTWNWLHDITFNEAYTPCTYLVLSAITLNTNSYKQINGGFQVSTFAQTFNFGTSQFINIREWLQQSSLATVNGADSTISVNGRFYGGSVGTGYGTVNINEQSYVTSAPMISCNLPFKELKIQGHHWGTYSTGIQLYTNITVTEQLDLIGDAINSRLLLNTANNGVPVTITCDGILNCSNTDFIDITGAGSADWDLSNISGGSGDCGGNSGITFTTPQTQYMKYVSGSNSWSNASIWHPNINGTGTGRVPLPQDDVAIATGGLPNGYSLTIDRNRQGKNIDFSNAGNTASIIAACETYFFGNVKLGGNKYAMSQISYFAGRGDYTIDCNGRYFGYTMNVYSPYGSYTLINKFNSDGGFLGIRQGSFYSDGKDIEVITISCSLRVGGTGIPLMTDLSNSLVVLKGSSGSNVYNTPTGTQATLNYTGTTFEIRNNASVNFSAGTNFILNNLRFKGSADVTINSTTSVTFNLIEYAVTGNCNIMFTNGGLLKYNDMIGGGSPKGMPTIKSTANGNTRFDKQTVGKVILNYVKFNYVNSLDVDTIYAVNSINNGNNTNITFGQTSELLARNKKADLFALM